MITVDAIQTYISTTLLEGQSGPIDVDQDLLISGILDSLNVMKLAAHLEKTGEITIPEHDVVLENFSTIAKMHDYLKTRGVAA